MPDQFGRPTMNDGLQMAQAISWSQRNQAEANKLDLEDQANAIAGLMDQGEELPEDLDPAVKFAASNKLFDSKIKRATSEAQQNLVTESGVKAKMSQWQANITIGRDGLNRAATLYRNGNEDAAWKILQDVSNNNAFNGYNVKAEDGKRTAQSLETGETIDISDMPITEALKKLGGYFGQSDEEIIEHSLNADQYRRNKNAQALEKAKDSPLVNAKGDVIYRATLVDPTTGAPTTGFFSPWGEKVSDEDAKGFKPMNVAEHTAKIGLVHAQTNASHASATASLANASANSAAADQGRIVRPSDLVQQDGKVGVVKQGKNGLEFVETKGMAPGAQGAPGTNPKGGGLRPFDANNLDSSKKRNDIETGQLKTLLIPFARENTPLLDDPESPEARTAFQSALNLLIKAEETPNELDAAEKKLVPHAKIAVELYQQITSRVADERGIAVMPQAPAAPGAPERKVVRTGKEKGTGRPIVQFDDGTIDYAN